MCNLKSQEFRDRSYFCKKKVLKKKLNTNNVERGLTKTKVLLNLGVESFMIQA